MNRSFSGRQAQRRGADFEQYFTRACDRQKIAWTRIPDGCKQVGAHKLIRVKSPFDFIISIPGKAAFIDTKLLSTHKPTTTILNQSQIEELLKHEKNNHVAGYVVYLRKSSKVLFVKSSTLLQSAKLRSAKPMLEHAVDLGTIFNIDLYKIFNPCANQAKPLDQQGATHEQNN